MILDGSSLSSRVILYPKSPFDDLLAAAPPLKAAPAPSSSAPPPLPKGLQPPTDWKPGQELPEDYDTDVAPHWDTPEQRRQAEAYNLLLGDWKRKGAAPAVPGMEQLGGTPPGPPRPPVHPEYNQFGKVPLGAPEYDQTVQGLFETVPAVETVGRGINRMANATPSPNAPANPKQMARGLSEVIGGTMQAVAPVVLPAGIAAAPVETALALGGATAADKATTASLKALGVAPEYADLAGNVAYLFGAYFAGGIRLSPEQQTLIEVLQGKDAPQAQARTIDALKSMVDRGGTFNERTMAQQALNRKFGINYGKVVPDAAPEPAAATPPETPPPAAAAPPEPAAVPTPAEAAPTPTKGTTYPSPQGNLTVQAVRGGKVSFIQEGQEQIQCLPLADFQKLITLQPVNPPSAPGEVSGTAQG